MKRFFGAILALVLVVAGAATAALGALGLAVFGTDGAYETTGRSVASAPESVAIIADLTGVEIGIPYHELLGEATISASAADGTELFLGQAEQSDVDAYLFGLPYDLATKNGSWSLTPVPGVETEVQPPQQAGFWVQSATGPAPTLTLQSQDQPQTLVLMRADGSADASATLTIGFFGERIGMASVAALVGGLLVVLLTSAFVLYRRRKRRRAARGAAQRTGADAVGPELVDLADAERADPAGVAEGAAEATTARTGDDSAN